MAEVSETRLPGVGVRHEFTTSSGVRVGVLAQRGGRREFLVYDERDPDRTSTVVHLNEDDSRTLAELLGASQVSEAVTAVQQELEGLAIEWLRLEGPFVGSTIGDGAFRSRTGVSIVAVIRDHTTIPAPGPEFRFESGDVAVAVGTPVGLARFTELVRG
jgi:TrkA domain protein